jgi:uncharacterized protein (DUF433 family)
VTPDLGSAPVDYRNLITLELGKRGRRPCVRGMRIAVSNVVGWLAARMSSREILADFPEHTLDGIQASLAFAADRERAIIAVA